MENCSMLGLSKSCSVSNSLRDVVDLLEYEQSLNAEISLLAI